MYSLSSMYPSQEATASPTIVEEGENKARKKMQYSGNRGSKSEESRTVGTEEGGPRDCQAAGLERSQCRSQQEEVGQAQEGA